MNFFSKSHYKQFIIISIICLYSHYSLANINPVNSASELDYPPFSIVLDDGKASGFSVELMTAALKSMGQEVNYKVSPWVVIKQELADGRLDALPLVGRSPEREKVFDFTFPYLTLYGAVFVRKEQNNLTSIEDLHNRRVGVLQGDNAEEYLHRKKITEHIISQPSNKDALLKLSRGELDAVVAQRIVALNLIKDLELDNIKTALAPINDFKQEFSFAVTEENKELLAILNEGLAIVIANGTYNELHKKWLGVLDYDNQKQKFFLMVTTIVTVVIILILLMLLMFLHIKRHWELVKNEENLKNINSRIRIATDSAQAGIWDYDIIKNEFIWDQRMFDIYDISSNTTNISYEFWEKIFYYKDRAGIKDEFQKVLSGKKEFDYKFRIKKPMAIFVG